MTSGRMPIGSRAPISMSLVTQTRAQAPSIWRSRLDEALDHAPLLRARQEMQDDLGVGGRREDGARRDELLAQRQRIGEVAVVGDGEAAGIDVGIERLDVLERRLARRRVAVVADGDRAREPADDGRLVKVIADEPEVALGVELLAVVADDAGRFLAAVLKRVEPERRDRRRIGVPKNTEDPAFLAEPIVAQSRKPKIPVPRVAFSLVRHGCLPLKATAARIRLAGLRAPGVLREETPSG